jgi:hypothetical protein
MGMDCASSDLALEMDSKFWECTDFHDKVYNILTGLKKTNYNSCVFS